MPLSPRVLALAALFGPICLVPACGRSSSKVGVSTNPEIFEDGKRQPKGATKESSTCLDPGKVLAGVEYTCADGKKRKGMFLANSLPECRKDGDSGCVATSRFKAADTQIAMPGVIKSGVTLAGVAGTLTFQGPAQCAADGETQCVAVTGFVAADTTGLASKVLSGQTVAGVAGNVTLPAANVVRTSVSYGVGGNGTTGTLADCALDGSVGCVTTASYKSATISGLAAKVISTATVAGESGTVVLPGTGDVRSGVAFGAASALSGSYSPDFPDVANVRSNDTVNGAAGTLADCSTDGATGCVVPSSGTIKAADTANFNGWDIRKKRNQTTGAVLTFAGLAGQSKTCRNRARTALYDNTTAPAAAGLDFFDTIDDYNNNLTGLPGEIPAWTIINSTNYGADYACGGIYATGDTSMGNTGADASLAHDANGNWQDLTPGILPSGSNSTNTANGCNASDKHCVFKELISGLMVTEVSATTYTWTEAISYCSNLGKAGGVVTIPIPVIGGAAYSDWRLPTQKELMHLYHSGVSGLNQTPDLTTFFSDVKTAYFWSSSTASSATSNAWRVGLGNGRTDDYGKASSFRVVCVK